MNWLKKLSSVIPVKEMLDHAYKAITATVGGNWKEIEQGTMLVDSPKYLWYSSLIMNGSGVYEENDRFSVRIFGMVRDSAEHKYISSFDSTKGDPLVQYHVVVAGNIPGRNWDDKNKVEWGIQHGVQIPMYEVGNTRPISPEEPLTFEKEVSLPTPFAVAEWVKDTIDRAYKDFGGGEDEGGGDFPEWPYPEGDFVEDPEEDANIRGLRSKTDSFPAKNDRFMKVQLPY